MQTVRLIGSFTPFIHHPQRESQLEREITLSTQSEVPDVGGKTYNHLYYKIKGGAMRKLLALPKFLAVLTVVAATLLLVGAASAGLVNPSCAYSSNGVRLWCYGWETQRGYWLGVIIDRYDNIYDPSDTVMYDEQIYVGNNAWTLVSPSRRYSGPNTVVLGGTETTGLPNAYKWFVCTYSNLTPPSYTIPSNNCGLPPNGP